MIVKNQEKRRIFVLAEKEGTGIAPITLELLGAAKKVATELNGLLCAVMIGHELADVSKEMTCWVDEVYLIDHPYLKSFKGELYLSSLEQLFQAVNPDVILMGSTIDNLDLAPRLAYKIGVQVITDCIEFEIEPETGCLLCTKPVYGAKVISTFNLIKKPYMATLRPKAAEPIGPGSAAGKIIHFSPVIDESSVKVELIEKIKEESIGLKEAEVIVAGGRGVQNAEGLDQVKDLVKAFKKYFNKVEWGASRPLVDAGFVSSSRQIGLTGEKVAPELYIAIGISGSLQHLTGILGAKRIIAINTNPKAYIFTVCDYGVIGNFEEVVPALKRKLEEL